MPSAASATDRARWLAELAAVLAEAQALTWTVGSMGSRPEALELYGRIEVAIAEVQSLRLGGRRDLRAEPDPNWSNDLPWASG